MVPEVTKGDQIHTDRNEKNRLQINYKRFFGILGADTKSRTRDLLITSQLLYQLSYVGTKGAHIMDFYRLGQVLISKKIKYFLKSFQWLSRILAALHLALHFI